MMNVSPVSNGLKSIKLEKPRPEMGFFVEEEAKLRANIW